MPKSRKLFTFSDDPADLTYALLDPADYISRFDDEITAARRMTVEEFVGDGDTVDLKAAGRLPVRFLGIDAAEKGLFRPLRADEYIPGEKEQGGYMPLTNDLWQEFMTDPLSEEWQPYKEPLPADLVLYLSSKWGPDARDNHAQWAEVARLQLVALIREDLALLERPWPSALFYTAYGTELLDAYGRLLCFLNISEPNPARRPLTYNERLLRAGVVIPYFIWPNVSPFSKLRLLDAALPPTEFRALAAADPALSAARAWCRAAREQPGSIFAPELGLQILPFELRYLAARIAPKRYVIDLGGDTVDNRLFAPARYFDIANVEDRLFVPPEYAPLLVQNGWQIAP